ncbi:MAG TPA: hypothetical protein VJS92_01625, partial [Candidatus Polarisedimenticolaceae bacterium]|nr:hypothetical protein [Candidatus Polarisedimenticolaceae bacterium]
MRTLAPTPACLDDDLLVDLAHGLLDEQARREPLDHLAHCAECDRRLRDQVRLRERLRATVPALGAERP